MNHAKQYMKHVGNLLSRAYLFPMYFLSGLFARRRDIWVFGSWGGYRYADNAAALFEHCNRELSGQVSAIWISRKHSIVEQLRERGYEAHWIWSARGMYCCLRAGLFLFDSFSKDINFWLSRGAVKINLWSGVPLKKCEREIDNPRSRYYRLFHGYAIERWFLSAMMPWHAVRPDYVIATSPTTRDVTCKTFDIAEENVWITGYPRNDALVSSNPASPDNTPDLPPAFAEAVTENQTVFLYLPTYRDSGKDFIDIDWTALEELMTGMRAKFFFKFHPDHIGTYSGALQHVVELPKAADIYDLLPHTDALISDYSSIIFDYMLLDKPIIYYVPDLEEFTSSSRSLNFQPDEIAVGPLCTTPQALLQALATIAENNTHYLVHAEWEETRTKFNTYTDGRCCQRVVTAIATNVPGYAFLNVPAPPPSSARGRTRALASKSMRCG